MCLRIFSITNLLNAGDYFSHEQTRFLHHQGVSCHLSQSPQALNNKNKLTNNQITYLVYVFTSNDAKGYYCKLILLKFRIYILKYTHISNILPFWNNPAYPPKNWYFLFLCITSLEVKSNLQKSKYAWGDIKSFYWKWKFN